MSTDVISALDVGTVCVRQVSASIDIESVGLETMDHASCPYSRVTGALFVSGLLTAS